LNFPNHSNDNELREYSFLETLKLPPILTGNVLEIYDFLPEILLSKLLPNNDAFTVIINLNGGYTFGIISGYSFLLLNLVK